MSLEIKNLTFSYKNLPLCQKDSGEENRVLDNFSASFEFGKITALTGDNGSGKTTLARLIMGIQKMGRDSTSQCSFIVDGENMDGWSLAERGRVIGYVMQNPAKQIFNETVLDELMYGLLNQGTEEDEAELTAREYIELFGLSHQMDEFPFNLSHGEKQRLVLATILAMKPRYLILDEPTASLDVKHKEVLGKLLRDVVRPECGIILISHDRKFVEEYCDEEVKLNA